MARITFVKLQPDPIHAQFEEMCQKLDLTSKLMDLWRMQQSYWHPEVVVSRNIFER